MKHLDNMFKTVVGVRGRWKIPSGDGGQAKKKASSRSSTTSRVLDTGLEGKEAIKIEDWF